MKISYNFTLDDYLEFLKYHTYNSKAYKYTKIFHYTIIPLIFINSMLMRYIEYGYLQSINIVVNIILIIFIVGLYSLFYKKITIFRLKYFLKHAKIDKFIGEQVMDLNDDSFIVKNNFSTVELKWKSILKIENTDKYIYLYNSNVSAHTIPKYKILEDVDELNTFINTKKSELMD